MLERLRERHPQARIDFVSLRENAAILSLLIPQIDRRITLDLGGGIPAFLLATLQTLLRLRRERYDLLYDLEFFTRFSAIFSRLVRPRRSHGFSSKSQWRGRLHDVQVPFNAYHHVALNFLTLLRGDPMDPIDTSPIEGDTALPPLRAPEAAWKACRGPARRRSGLARERADRRRESERRRTWRSSAAGRPSAWRSCSPSVRAPRARRRGDRLRRPSASTSSP